MIEDREYYPVCATTSRKADVRIIATTNLDEDALLRGKRMRDDLYYRFKNIIDVPPLGARREDVGLLAHHFCRMATQDRGARRLALSPEAVQAIEHVAWPGNVRELYHAVARAVELAHYEGARVVDARHIFPDKQPPARAPQSLKDAIRALKREHVLAALQSSLGNVSHAARLLGIPRPRVYPLMKELGLDRPCGERGRPQPMRTVPGAGA